MRRTNIKLTSVTVKTSHSCPRYTVHCNEKHIVTCLRKTKGANGRKDKSQTPFLKEKSLKKCQKLFWHNLWMQTEPKQDDEEPLMNACA